MMAIRRRTKGLLLLGGGLGCLVGRLSPKAEPVTTGEWSIYWAASTGNGRFGVPRSVASRARGASSSLREVFEGSISFNRFIWTVETPDRCRWQQAHSADGGKTWETHWIMEFARQV